MATYVLVPGGWRSELPDLAPSTGAAMDIYQSPA